MNYANGFVQSRTIERARDLIFRNFNLLDSPLKRGDFVVMVRQAHHERHCILSLSKDQSNDKGVCKNAFNTLPAPLSRGELKSRCQRQPNLMYRNFKL